MIEYTPLLFDIDSSHIREFGELCEHHSRHIGSIVIMATFLDEIVEMLGKVCNRFIVLTDLSGRLDHVMKRKEQTRLSEVTNEEMGEITPPEIYCQQILKF